jgi:hypothetical protein
VVGGGRLGLYVVGDGAVTLSHRVSNCERLFAHETIGPPS